jgi:hypothetical protein
MTIETELPAVEVKEELKPCPFCGGTVLRTGGDDKIVGVSCLRCEACGPNHYGQHEWNDRANTLSPLPHVEPIGYCVWISPTKLAACAKRTSQSFPVYAAPVSGTLKDDPGNGGEAEPVAWRFRYDDGKWNVQKNKPAWYRDFMIDVEIEPLFSLSSYRKGREADG